LGLSNVIRTACDSKSKKFKENYTRKHRFRKQYTTANPPLTTPSFVLEFEYGINAQGYWSYQKMVMHMEYGGLH
jgi:hypothetical protein